MTPLVPASRLAEELGIGELWLKLDTANPTHSFKDRVVAVAARKAQELGFDTLSCSSTGNLAGAVAARAAAEGLEAAVFVPSDLEPEKLAAAAVYGPRIYAVDGTYDHCSRLSVELSFELPWGFVNVNLRSYYAEGSKTLAYEIAEQLGWETPDAVAIPIASGALFHKVGQGFGELATLGLVDGTTPRAVRRAGGRVRARRDRVPRGHARRAGAACEHRPLARDRQPGGRRLRRRHGALHGWCDPHRRPRTRSARTWRISPRRRASSARRRPGVTLGALKAAVAAGQVGPRSRVVLLVTGDGLKTPGPVAHTYDPIMIEADADAFVERGAGRLMAGQSLFDKVWGRHVVRDAPGEPALLYIDLHLVHEVTSPQAFDGLRLAGRGVRRPDLTVATMDHNVPTLPGPITDPMAKAQLDALRANCDEFGIELHGTGSGHGGDRSRDRARARPDPAGQDDRVRRQPHVDPRRVRRARVRDRHLGGRARARDADAEPDADRRRCCSSSSATCRRGSPPRT